jgi:hypothetical protein
VVGRGEPFVGRIARTIPDVERFEAPGTVASVADAGTDPLLVGKAFVRVVTRPELLHVRKQIGRATIDDARAVQWVQHLYPVSEASS